LQIKAVKNIRPKSLVTNIQFILLLLFIVILFQPLYPQKYLDSIYDKQERISVGTFLKYIYNEKLFEFYENDIMRLKLLATIDQLRN